jgi:NhaA family Na+:H+ antiporter
MKNKPVSYFRISSFINEETYGGLLLILATFVALFWANSNYYESYHHVWHEIKVGFVWGKVDLISSIHHWINDGLMALFFFVIGLEIKREIMGGELSTMKKASLPIAAALGGMILPALFYVGINGGIPEYDNGWGIPMATDIAFALGLLAMLGKRVPLNLKIFLTALAIADDLGAVMVIAVFYTESIDFYELMYASFFLVVLVVANLAGIRRTIFYALIGFAGVWIAFVYSGVHATIAGVLIALTIPARTKIDETRYIDRLSNLLDKYKKQEKKPGSSLLTPGQVHVLSEITHLNDQAHTPLQRIEHTLHPVTAYFILPVFALSNAGVHIDGEVMDMLSHPISIGIMLGLVLGKLIGISLLSRLVVRLKLASLPSGVEWNHIYGASLLAGIGFTMSIFISDLAFADEKYIQIAKVGIMAASLISAVLGMLWLSLTSKKSQ